MCIYFVLFHLTSSRVYQVLVKNWRWSLLRHAKDKLFYKSKYSAFTSSSPSIVSFLNHGAKQPRPYRGRSVVYLSVSDHGRFHQWREEGVGVSGEGRKKVPHCLVCRHPGESCPHLPSASGVDERCEAEGERGGIQDDYMTCTCLIKATMLCYDRHLHVRGCVWQMWFQCCGSLSLSLSVSLCLSLSLSRSTVQGQLRPMNALAVYCVTVNTSVSPRTTITSAPVTGIAMSRLTTPLQLRPASVSKRNKEREKTPVQMLNDMLILK